MRIIVVLSLMFSVQLLFAQDNSISKEINAPQNYLFERADETTIVYMPPGEIEGMEDHGFSFFTPNGSCEEGPFITVKPDPDGKTFTYKVKGAIFLVLQMEEDKIIVTEKNCPAAGKQCTNWSGTYLKLAGRY